MTEQERIRLAERVRDACIGAAVQAFDDTGIQGLCVEGRIEAAIAAMRTLELNAFVRDAG